MMKDLRNIKDEYKGWVEDLIKEDLKLKALPFGILMFHLFGDFNIGTILRSANAFGAQRMYYFGKKHWDRRGACGTQNYSKIEYLPTFNDILNLKKIYSFVALENTANATSILNFSWPSNPLIIVGEESNGLNEEILNNSDFNIFIPMRGSVRSLNVATAAGIAMYDYTQKYTLK